MVILGIMSETKKQVRANFRNAVFARAKYRCEGPGCTFKSTPQTAEKDLDAHHVTDRNELPNGGYVKENGIALCPKCHENAEIFHCTGEALPGFSPEDLYKIIGSSLEKARRASERIK